jgi:hypothetical protein
MNGEVTEPYFEEQRQVASAQFRFDTLLPAAGSFITRQRYLARTTEYPLI